MAIYVHNGTASTMYVALAYHSPNCDGDNWAKKGWWQIGPGGRTTIRGGASNGAKYFWYAENDAGSNGPARSSRTCRAGVRLVLADVEHRQQPEGDEDAPGSRHRA